MQSPLAKAIDDVYKAIGKHEPVTSAQPTDCEKVAALMASLNEWYLINCPILQPPVA